MEQIKELILASGSPRRKELLMQIGIQPEICPSGAPEDTKETRPDAVVEELSERKCLDVAQQVTDGVILGADTVVAVDGKILGKPADEGDAFRMLSLLQGRDHQVYTGVTLAKKEAGELKETDTFSVCTHVFVAAMTPEEITEYIRTGEPMDKAGAYGIQGFFAKYITRLEGDYFNVVGLPLAALYEHLKDL